MRTYETYIKENHSIVRALVGCEIESFYRLAIEEAEDGEDDLAHCIDSSELIVVTNVGELLFAIDQGTRNLIIFWIDPGDPKWGPHGRARARIRADVDRVNAVELLVGSPIVSVAIVSRPGPFENHGSFCGLALSTSTSKAWVGSYLTETDDAGVSLLTKDELADGLIESALEFEPQAGDSQEESKVLAPKVDSSTTVADDS